MMRGAPLLLDTGRLVAKTYSLGLLTVKSPPSPRQSCKHFSVNEVLAASRYSRKRTRPNSNCPLPCELAGASVSVRLAAD